MVKKAAAKKVMKKVAKKAKKMDFAQMRKKMYAM